MADPVVHITNGLPDSGTGNITTLGQTLVDGANATLGITTGAAVSTDATGTLQQYLRGLVKLFTTATFKAASTAPTAADPALVVAISPNGQNVNGRKDPVNAAPVVDALATDQTSSRVDAAASTNATNLKASAGSVLNIDIFNVAAYSVFLKLYNKASAPTLSLATPVNSGFSTTSTGGSLAQSTTYYYRVSATNANGETLASTETSQVVGASGTATNTVTVNWGAVTGATGYRIYGRSTGAELFIAAVGAVTTYTDTGAITPSGALPSANTTADTPAWTIPIAAGAGFSRSFPKGKFFGTGISYAITKLQADSDTTALTAHDATGVIDWV
jgi:hypothetical protein